MPASTTNYSWNLPTVGGDEDDWGGYLNANWTALDTLLGGVNSTEFAILDGATVTVDELNLLDGVTWALVDYNDLTATAAELNILDGATVTVDEINILDGDTAATATTLADADRLVTNDDGTMVQVAMTDVRDYLLIDEDDMASDSETKAPSQQSVKAYVDAEVSGNDWTYSAATATTSGTEIDFTGLPSGLSELKLIFDGVSLSGGDDFQIQIGTSGGLVTSGYASTTVFAGSAGNERVSSSSGFRIRVDGGSEQVTGVMDLVSPGSNFWVSTHVVSVPDQNSASHGAGSVSLGGVLDRLRLTTTGTNTFDAGRVFLAYR